MFAELNALIVLALLGAIWSWALQGRERALAVTQRVCREMSLQQLDQSVSLHSIRLRWWRTQPRLERVYRFEFSLSGADRHGGEVGLLGARPRWIRLAHPDGSVHVDLN